MRAKLGFFREMLPASDPVLVFALVMLIVLLAPIVFKRMRLPGMVGLIVAGAIVGPSGLGILERDATMILLGTVGLLYLIFVAGLSIDLNQFERLRNRSIVFGLISFSIPMALSLVVSTAVLGYSNYAALLVGSVVGSHTLLAYPIAQRLGISRNLGVTMATGGTILTDTLALTVLAVVIAAAAGSVGLAFWGQFIGFAAVYAVAVLFGLPQIGRWFFRYARNETNVEFVFLITLLFLTAFFAGLAGLAPIIGAFLCGLTLNRLVPDNGVLMSRVRFVGDSLFIPFFLISVGMLVNFSVLVRSFEIWGVAGSLIGLVVGGKMAAAKIVQYLYGRSAAEGWTVFGLTVPQAAATLAVTLVGFEVGLLDQVAVNAVVIMILGTCIVGPIMVERFGREVAFQEETQRYDARDAPQRILVPLANPATAEGLMDVAFLIRGRKLDEAIYPLTVVRGGPGVEGHVARSERMLSHAVIHATAADVPVNPLTRVDMNIAGGIERAITETRISTVVIGWNGEVTAPERIFGSVLDHVLDQAQQTIHVVKADLPIATMVRVVVLMHPFAEREPGTSDAVRNIKTLADQLGAALKVVCPLKHREAVQQSFRESGPKLEFEMATIERWGDLLGRLRTTLTRNDLLVLVSARRGSLTWRPGLDRLPAAFSQQLGHPNFMIIYPTEIAPVSSAQSVLDKVMPRLLEEERVVVGIENLSPRKVLERLVLESRLTDEPVVKDRLVGSLLENAPEYLPEIASGVVLFHAHTDEVDRPKLFIGTSRQGLRFQAEDRQVHVVLLLLSPREYSPESHLHTLATIGRMFRGKRIVEQLKDAQSVDEIMNILAEKLLKSGDRQRKPGPSQPA